MLTYPYRYIENDRQGPLEKRALFYYDYAELLL